MNKRRRHRDINEKKTEDKNNQKTYKNEGRQYILVNFYL